MNRKQLEECAWKKTPKDERRSEIERYDWTTKKSVTKRLRGNEREVLVFDPSGSTPGSMSPWVPLWSLYSDELEQRCREEQQPKLRAPYNRMRADYTGDVESSPGTKSTREGISRPHHATKQGALSQAALKALDAIDFGEPVSAAMRARLVREGLVTEGGRLTERGQAAVERRLAHEVLGRDHSMKKSPAQLQREIDEVLSRPPSADPFEEAKRESAEIEREVDAASDALRAFPRGPTGLTPDAVRATPEYRAANARYQKAFARQRAFNAGFTKRFAKELRAERASRDAARQRR